MSCTSPSFQTYPRAELVLSHPVYIYIISIKQVLFTGIMPQLSCIAQHLPPRHDGLQKRAVAPRQIPRATFEPVDTVKLLGQRAFGVRVRANLGEEGVAGFSQFLQRFLEHRGSDVVHLLAADLVRIGKEAVGSGEESAPER